VVRNEADLVVDTMNRREAVHPVLSTLSKKMDKDKNFSSNFLPDKVSDLKNILTEVCFLGYNLSKVSIVSINGLSPIWRQAIYFLYQ